jgi:hypothetical protein
MMAALAIRRVRPDPLDLFWQIWAIWGMTTDKKKNRKLALALALSQTNYSDALDCLPFPATKAELLALSEAFEVRGIDRV